VALGAEHSTLGGEVASAAKIMGFEVIAFGKAWKRRN
jgi:hypothetical protein